MMSQPDFDKACVILKDCLQDLGWRSVSAYDQDGGFTKEFYLWSNVDEHLLRPAITATIYVNRKSLDVNPVDRHKVTEWLRRGFPMLTPERVRE